MPRGDNPNSRKNLKPINSLGEKEKREFIKKGQEASKKVRANYKDMRQSLREILTPEKSDKIMDMLTKKIEAGNLKALELALKMMGSDISESKTKLEALQAEKLQREINGEINDVKIEITLPKDMDDYAD